MKLVIKAFSLVLLALIASTQLVHAQAWDPNGGIPRCSSRGIQSSISPALVGPDNVNDIVLTVTEGLIPGEDYSATIKIYRNIGVSYPISNGRATIPYDAFYENTLINYPVMAVYIDGPNGLCYTGHAVTVLYWEDTDGCSIRIENPNMPEMPFCGGTNSDFNIYIDNATYNGQPIDNETVTVWGTTNVSPLLRIPLDNGAGFATLHGSDLTPGESSTLRVKFNPSSMRDFLCQTANPIIVTEAESLEACQAAASGVLNERIFSLCSAAGTDAAGQSRCTECAGQGGIWTSVGCLQTDPNLFIPVILRLAGGVAGGLALLIMLVGAFMVSTSAGNPDSVKKGQEMITAAIAGLLFIIFSIVILQIIGVDILGIPGF